ncbi:WYL domain-containing protein [Azotobacter beijerinckii]|uniref:WYL domain-containing protein n=1 Tax=Azotobacter beijerinckii TaxID=170623 RepID=UPI000B8A0720|nr:WYL domain-containing protein [Azotobacter beijerinckii]
MEREDDGGYRLNATVQDSWQLHWWLLSQSGALAVRAPQALREKLLAALETGLATHRERCPAAW